MGYNTDRIEIHVRLDNHYDERTVRDGEALAHLRMEIDALIASTPDYARIVTSVWGG